MRTTTTLHARGIRRAPRRLRGEREAACIRRCPGGHEVQHRPRVACPCGQDMTPTAPAPGRGSRLGLCVCTSPGSRGCGRARGFLLKRHVSLYRQGDLRYDGTSQKLCRRGTSWPLPFIKSVRWPTCLWRWGSSASSTSRRSSIPSARHTPRMSSRVAGGVEALLLAILDGHHALYKVGARLKERGDVPLPPAWLDAYLAP